MAKKKKQQRKVKKHLTTKGFANTLLNEIGEVVNQKPYHAFLLMATFNEFAKFELGLNIFKDHRVNKGLNYMTNHYRPLGLWLMSKEQGKKKHMAFVDGRVCLDVNKTFNEIKKAVSKMKLDNKPFLFI